jgi:parvulin-like peptidyl-prolyl isomerase
MKISYSQGVITPEEIIRFLTLSGQLHSLINEIIKNREVMKKAKELKILVPTDELQQYADSFRVSRGLFSSEDTQNFLKTAGLNEGDFEGYCEARILTLKLMDRLADEHQIEEYFVSNHSDFDLARISRIVVKEKSLAQEILIQIQEEGKDFHAGAKEYSIDQSTKFGGGYVGQITRNMLQPEAAAKVFNASSGEVLGPFEIEGLFELILVEEVVKAEFNETVKERIKRFIFEEWISQFINRRVTISL